MKVFFLLLFIILFTTSKSQNCIDTSSKSNYYALGHKLSIGQNLVDNNNKIVFFGRYSTVADTGYTLIKLKQDETVDFAKKIKFTNQPRSLYVMKTKCLKNGRFITAFSEGTGDEEGASLFFMNIALFENDGTLVWSKKYERSLNGISVMSIDETTNSDFLLRIKATDDGENLNGFLKINPLGNVLWCKYYYNIDLQSYFESVSIIGKNIFLKGTIVYDQSKPYTPKYEHRTIVAKINATTSDLIDSKSYMDIRVQDELPSIVSSSLNSTSQITTAQNDMLLTSKLRSGSYATRGFKRVILDTNLNFHNPFFYSVPYSLFIKSGIIGNKNKEIFINSYTTTNNNVPTGSFVNKIDSNNVQIRSIYQNFPSNIAYQFTGIKSVGLRDKYLNIINSYTQAGNSYFQLVQFPDNVPITACYGKDTNLIQVEPYTMTEVMHPFFNASNSITDITVSNFPITITPLPLIMQKECEIISNCNLLKINPVNDTICNLANEVQFSAHINGSCLKKVYWQLDTSAYTYIRAINDTMVAIKFKQNWQGKLYASINSCLNIKDSVKLNVFNTPTYIQLGNDTSLCIGATITLQAGVGFKDYTWQNGSTSNTLTVSAAGSYSVLTHDICGNTFKDTINVKYFLKPVITKLGNDTTLCKNETLTLFVSKGYKTYLWQDGSIADSFKVAQTGTYFVKAIDSCGNIFKDTIVVSNFINRPSVNLGADFIFCPQKTYLLEAGIGYKKYTWQDGSINNSFTATQAGTYFVKVEDSCGNASVDTLQIKQAENVTLKLDFTNTICLYDTARLILPTIFSQYKIDPTNSFELQNNILKLFPNQNTIYNIKSNTVGGCIVNDTLLIKVKLCEDELYFPTAFTPNGDNTNDYFLPYAETKPIKYELNIYNIYGQNIFSSNNIKSGWNGRLFSQVQNTGSYVWICKYQFRNKLLKLKKGSFILVK